MRKLMPVANSSPAINSSEIVEWRLYQNSDFVGYQNALPHLTKADVMAKFEKRTGIMATDAVGPGERDANLEWLETNGLWPVSLSVRA